MTRETLIKLLESQGTTLNTRKFVLAVYDNGYREGFAAGAAAERGIKRLEREGPSNLQNEICGDLRPTPPPAPPMRHIGDKKPKP